MKNLKKLISAVLVMIMLLSCCSSGLAYAEEASEHLPQIYVNGIGSRKVYNQNDPDKTSLFYPVNMDGLLENLKNFKTYLEEAIKSGEPNLVYYLAYNVFYDTMGEAALKPDGITSGENVIIDPCPLDYGGNGKYYFNYDSRLDPVDLAHQLHEYIPLVKEHSNSERFEMVGSSYGTEIIMAYINEYPEELSDIDSILLCVPSFNGVDFVGEVFSGRLNVDPDGLAAFVSVMTGNSDLALVMDVLRKSGMLDLVVNTTLEPIMYMALMRAARDFVHDVVGTFPAMWTFVQDKYFYDALENIYGENYRDENHEYAGLIGRIIYYHENVMVKSDELIARAQEKGIKMNIICKYGRPTVPLTEKGNIMSDGLVSLNAASFGATASMYGETLGDGYKQARHTEYKMLSPDGCVDASTGALPFNTWYIRGLEHGTKTDEYFEMINRIVYDDLDVFTSAQYPQFLDCVGEEIVPLTAEEEKEETSFFEDLISLMKRLAAMLADWLKSLGK